jgi:hypothetical protein
MYLFLHVLYSIKACKNSIYVVQFVVRNMSCYSVRWTDLVVWDSSSVVIAVCVFLVYNMIVKLIKLKKKDVLHALI